MYKLTVLFIVLAFVHLDGLTQDIYDACRKGNVELIKQLSKVNPDTINTPNKSGYTPLIIAGYRNQLDAVKMLLDLGANVNANSEDGTVLTAASYKSNTALVKLLLEYHSLNLSPAQHNLEEDFLFLSLQRLLLFLLFLRFVHQLIYYAGASYILQY